METPNNKLSGSLGAGSTVSVMSEIFSKPIEIPRPHMRVVDSDEVGLHQVTFSVIISIAVTAETEVPEAEKSKTEDKKNAKKGKEKDNKDKENQQQKATTSSSPQPLQYLHCEYQLFPGDLEPVRTDVVNYGPVAKIYTEMQESKVVKTWTDCKLTWISWTHCHTVTVTESFLKSLVDHKVTVSVWDDKEKCAPKVKLDRLKAVKFADVKADDFGKFGVEEQVQKQMKDFNKYQSKRTIVDDAPPLPSCQSEKKEEEPKEEEETTKGGKDNKKGGKNAKKKDAKKEKKESPPKDKLKNKKDIDVCQCSLDLSFARLFAGAPMVTARLGAAVETILGLYLSIDLNSTLLSCEQKLKLNPLVIEVRSASGMPKDPIPIRDLRSRCKPCYIKYRMLNEQERVSPGLPQNGIIYWNDVNVILAGLLDPSQLREYLHGPGLEIEVHDRDRITKLYETKASLFGLEANDGKISNIGTVACKRTIVNAFLKDDKPWDPYGVARLSLSDFLLGITSLHVHVPILNSPLPHVLGLDQTVISKAGFIGEPGSVDGPVEPPLQPGDYVTSGASLKVSIHLAIPLTTPVKLASKERSLTGKCPYSRIVFRFGYLNTDFLHELQSQVSALNACALGLDNLPSHVIPTVLSTINLSQEQEMDDKLDILTGFRLFDGETHLVVLEGLVGNGIKTIAECNDLQLGVELLYHSDMTFEHRLYTVFGVDLHCIRLHEPLRVIMQQPFVYIRDMMPLLCYQCLDKLQQLNQFTKLRIAIQNDVFPSAEEMIVVSREFGVPITSNDFSIVEQQPPEIDCGVCNDVPVNSLDFFSPSNNLESAPLTKRKHRNAHKRNMEHLARLNERAKIIRCCEKVDTFEFDVPEVYNSGNQKLNNTELAKKQLRKMIARDKEHLYSYCPEYLSATFDPVDIDEYYAKALEKSREKWMTSCGWIDHIRRSSQEKNAHPKQPDPSRVDELQVPLDELWDKDAISGDRGLPFCWDQRKLDLDLWTTPEKIQSMCCCHGRSIFAEGNLDCLPKIKPEPAVAVHRCAIETELTECGFKSSNQLDRLRGILKDPPRKQALQNQIGEIPALSVVANPSVDRDARISGKLISMVEMNAEEEARKAKFFNPGDKISIPMRKNCIAIPDYQRAMFEKMNGQDFNVYHKERSKLSGIRIKPLTGEEVCLINRPNFCHVTSGCCWYCDQRLKHALQKAQFC